MHIFGSTTVSEFTKFGFPVFLSQNPPIKIRVEKGIEYGTYIYTNQIKFLKEIRVSKRFDKTIVSAWKIAVSMILCNGRPA